MNVFEVPPVYNKWTFDDIFGKSVLQFLYVKKYEGAFSAVPPEKVVFAVRDKEHEFDRQTPMQFYEADYQDLAEVLSRYKANLFEVLYENAVPTKYYDLRPEDLKCIGPVRDYETKPEQIFTQLNKAELSVVIERAAHRKPSLTIER
jgi:hypothetical protein